MNSQVESANRSGTDFPLENLPYGMSDDGIVVAIGSFAFHVTEAARQGLCEAPTSLNELLTWPAEARAGLRAALQDMLAEGAADRSALMAPLDETALRKPVDVGDYTDFYASIYHATNVGRLFRPDNPLLPNYKYVPIGYHARASSLVLSGTAIPRPNGQTMPASAVEPVFGPTRSLDYELEAGFYIAEGNALGEPVPIDQAESRIFGFSLLNDWSARDIQAWEYQPLGPFLSKSFATSISPWIVTMEALEPFRTPAFQRLAGDPEPPQHLDSQRNRTCGGIDLTLEVWLSSAQMRGSGTPPVRLCQSNLRDLYWTPAQLLAHHTSNGCNLRPGDLLASGTVSGDSPTARGCLLELTRRGAEPLLLPTGEKRAFLENGDEVVLKGYCERPGAKRIGFGECRGAIIP